MIQARIEKTGPDEDVERWDALARLQFGIGEQADFELLARDFRGNYLVPEQISIQARLWIDVCLQRLLDGEAPEKVFRLAPKMGRPKVNPRDRAYWSLRFEQLKRAHSRVTDAQSALLGEMHKADFKTVSKAYLIPQFGASWDDEQLARRIEVFAPKK